MCRRVNLSLKWFITVRAGLHHGLSVNHLPEDFHRVVQQLCRPDAGPAGGFGLLELSQQVTGPQGPFRQRLLHPAHTLGAWFQTFLGQLKTQIQSKFFFPALPLTCAGVGGLGQLGGRLHGLLHQARTHVHRRWNWTTEKR